MSDTTPCLVWFRQDLRLSDNPALAAALAHGSAVVPVYIWSPEEEGAWAPGAASRWWLHRSLTKLGVALETRGSRLIVGRGPTEEALETFIAETGADAVFWNDRYEPAAIARDDALKAKLRAAGLKAESFNGSLLFEPGAIRTAAGEPFRMFKPFWRACMKQKPPAQTDDATRRIPAPAVWPQSLTIEQLKLQPAIDWAAGLREAWQPGEEDAKERLRIFRRDALARYASARDRVDRSGASRLSPHLHFGEVSPGEVWRAVMARVRDDPRECESYLRQLVWREFAYHLLYHFPQTAESPMRQEFSAFPWRMRRDWFEAWKRGKTGYPLVDAGMRELWRTGSMHNRARLVAASFLVKHLLIPWQEGAKWFWDTLVDADLANNTLNWQWVAGCGADAAPYFRIFNPALQAKRFDPFGEYVKRWVPEAGAQDYPPPIIDHSEARTRALRAWQRTGKRSSTSPALSPAERRQTCED
jgi:deoxyribodipyrimidine photo-lyase